LHTDGQFDARLGWLGGRLRAAMSEVDASEGWNLLAGKYRTRLYLSTLCLKDLFSLLGFLSSTPRTRMNHLKPTVSAPCVFNPVVFVLKLFVFLVFRAAIQINPKQVLSPSHRGNKWKLN
jgi:hypothetical protein